MARITNDDKQDTASRILLLVGSYPDGIREVDLAELLKMEKRTMNNYLRRLREDGRVQKNGFNWYATQSELDSIESDLIDAVHRLFDYLRKRNT